MPPSSAARVMPFMADVVRHEMKSTAFRIFRALRRIVGCLRYSQEQLYAVVAGVEHYKEFVPWCQRSHIIDRKPPGFVEAELEVGFKMFVERCDLLTSHIGTPAIERSPELVLWHDNIG